LGEEGALRALAEVGALRLSVTMVTIERAFVFVKRGEGMKQMVAGIVALFLAAGWIAMVFAAILAITEQDVRLVPALIVGLILEAAGVKLVEAWGISW
jgi:hypothetical protein